MLFYQQENNLSPEEFIDVLIRSTLSDRRPIHDLGRMKKMLQNASIVLTCRNQSNKLIGISRSITDYAYCTYLSDLAVDVKFQRKGVGKELIRLTHERAGHHTALVLLSAPNAETYYENIQLRKHKACFVIDRK